MAKINYLDKHGLGTLIKLIKRGQTGVYVVKGRAIYADTAFLALTPAEKEAIATGASSITAAGIYQLTDGAWTAVDTTKTEEGDVYDIINAFTTDATFREGAGHLVDAGTNIVAVNVGTAAAPSLKWDLFSGILDLDKYQTKKLLEPLTVFENETPTVYTSAASLPATEPVATATITDLMVAIMGDGDEKGDVYRASVTVDETDPTVNNIAWVKLGNQDYVEGSLAFLGSVAANTPITDEEIEDLWANA